MTVSPAGPGWNTMPTPPYSPYIRQASPDGSAPAVKRARSPPSGVTVSTRRGARCQPAAKVPLSVSRMFWSTHSTVPCRVVDVSKYIRGASTAPVNGPSRAELFSVMSPRRS